MKRILGLSMVIVLLLTGLVGVGWCTDYYCRPICYGGYGNSSGTSYANAWDGVSSYAVVNSINTTNDTMTLNSTGNEAGFSIAINQHRTSPSLLGTRVRFTGTLPTGISANTDYWLKRSSAYNCYVYTDSALTNLVNFTDTGGAGSDLKIWVGIDWDLVTAGDTIYICDTHGFNSEVRVGGASWNITLQGLNTFRYLKSGTAVNPITIQGHPDHPATLIIMTNQTQDSATWVQSAWNSNVYYLSPGPSGNQPFLACKVTSSGSLVYPNTCPAYNSTTSAITQEVVEGMTQGDSCENI